MHTRTLLWISAALGVATLPSWPQAPPDPSDAQAAGPAEFFETATVEARRVSSSAGSVTVIGAEEIERSGARSASELLSQVAGLGLLSSGGRAGVTNAFVRGGDPNFTLVLLDGVPFNDSTELQGGAVNLEELSAGLVERAELVRGPLTSFYGPGSLAGVIQLFSRRGGPGPLRVSAGATAGNAEQREAFARVAGPSAGGGYAAGVTWDQERRRVGQDSFRGLDAWATWDRSLGATTDVGLTTRVAGGEADDYPDSSGGPVYGDGLLRHSERLDLAFGARLELGERGGRRQRVSLGLSRRGLDRTSPAVPPLVPASLEQTTFTRLRLAYEVPLLHRARTTLDLGVSGEAEWGKNGSLLRLPDFLGGDVPGDYRKTRTSAGVYLGLRHERGPVLLEAGLRADRAGGAGLQANPSLGLVMRLDEAGAMRLRALAGRASKLPSFFALASPAALGGNPQLEAERVLGGEVGIERSVGSGRLEAGATLFRQDYRGLVDFDFERFLHVNRARVRSQGAELSLRVRPSARVSLEGLATWLDAKDLSGAPLLHRPRWQGGGRLSVRPVSRLWLRIEQRAVASTLDRQLAVPARATVAAYSLWSLAGSWRLGEHWTIRGRLGNLGDRSYETLIGFPGPRRSFRIGLTWDRLPVL